jgi:hypothetical protein
VHHSDGIVRITQDRIDDLHRAARVRWSTRRSMSRAVTE